MSTLTERERLLAEKKQALRDIKAATRLSREADTIRVDAILHARSLGLTYTRIGVAAGISRQAARELELRNRRPVQRPAASPGRELL